VVVSRHPLIAPDTKPPFPEEPRSAKVLKASQSVLDFARPAEGRAERRKKRGFRASSKSIADARAEVGRRAGLGEWEGATGLHLVALYERLHEGVYGAAPIELDAQGWAFAGAAAGRMIEQKFGGDSEKAVCFLRWTWRREEDREKWRRANGRAGGRVGWRYQFCASSLVDDYRVDQARRKL
jgi:hypothetical protein